MTTAPKSELLKLASLAEYQTGAVVSRQITKADGGNITLLLLMKSGAHEHTAPFDALVHVLDGEAEIRSPGSHSCLYLAKP